MIDRCYQSIMYLRATVGIIILWSSISSGTPKTQSSTPIISPALTSDSALKFVSPGSLHDVGTMPAYTSQDTVGSCFGCAAAVILQKHICDTDEELKESGIACNSPAFPKNKKVSQFSMVGWSDTIEDRTVKSENPQESGIASNHASIKLYKDRTDYSSGSNALQNITKSTFVKYMPESCFPFDQIVNTYHEKGKEILPGRNILFETIYEKTREFYEKNKKKQTESNAVCTTCIKELGDDFGSNFEEKNVAIALSKKTYGEFLYALLFKNCSPIKVSKKPQYKEIPEGKKTLPREKILENLQKIIADKKKPVQVNSLCLKLEGAVCTSYHTTVVSGYRVACPTNNYSGAGCRKQLLIHNCWGKDWQDQNNGGWVDADLFVQHIDYGQPSISGGELSWLEPEEE